MFINPTGEYEIFAKENGKAEEILLEILIKAESIETDKEMMDFRFAGGKMWNIYRTLFFIALP